jgi:hypothetical protein
MKTRPLHAGALCFVDPDAARDLRHGQRIHGQPEKDEGRAARSHEIANADQPHRGVRQVLPKHDSAVRKEMLARKQREQPESEE